MMVQTNSARIIFLVILLVILMNTYAQEGIVEKVSDSNFIIFYAVRCPTFFVP